ncbi:TPA: XVIPCD domain-containing protein [Stenotrophomonas maltophilia]|uniref:XVIPCD domain-containing protein n=1 Tax=Gammaproteobacteria TaxID=1236 RepID=UPI00041537EA|nr:MULTISPECIES: XVIPCD domain-containing protein [Gammaproteobacteria]KOO74003.1 lytic enzyme [Stenotrophomonas maltophilia]MBA0258498.1 lytic enzyme [Stenotrophomonas maltophilia]MBA0315312.1 lytic enzyme [Stenotrophomonas maltophilia]MBB1135502.1 lytic enzyme [Stenotrophomonas sp. I18B00994]MBH1669502.1 lytic enzyme [Stenotrophomonas maltophilia]
MSTDRESQLLRQATKAGIDSPLELANFMAQAGHESRGLSRLNESFNFTRGISQIPVEAAWRNGNAALESARQEALRGRPENLAELMYGGRMGNDAPGDALKYHGRGYLPLVGKENYERAGKALDLDLVNHPELAAQPEYAGRIAVWQWQTRVPEGARHDVREATYALNGALNGIEARRQRFEVWQQKLTPDVMARLDRGEVGAPAQTVARDMSHAGEPGNALFEDARQHLRQMGPQSGLRSAQELDNTAGALALGAQKAGLSRIDHLLAGNDGRTLFAVQGALGDPAMLRASVDREQASQQPLAQSSQQLAASVAQQDPTAALAREQEQRSRSL